ncbi:MAG: PepSY-like domain-containing protein [Chitinophagaceae bacterium]|nr:PepSY-like domain-containing protein [Chitinophagaceae bacterium]
MKKIILAALLLKLTDRVSAQDIAQNELPSLVRNSFQKTFPKASDVEWETEGGLYKVEFETGLFGTDHHAWFDGAGKLVRHKEEIGKSDLPAAVRSKLDKAFSGYRVDDIDKISTGTKVTYTMELKRFTEEWKVAFDAAGNMLSKIAD